MQQHSEYFLVCGLTSDLECLAEVFKNHFLVKKAEMLNLRSEHRKETHFLKRQIYVDGFGWRVELDQQEVAGPTAVSKTKLNRIARYFKGRHRCVLNFPWVAQWEDVIHVTVDAEWAGDPKTRCSTSGGVLAIGPCFTVRHWSVTQATMSRSSIVTKGCIESLYVKHLLEHQTARPFKIEVWTNSSSAEAIMQRLGPGRKAKHLEVHTLWVQQLSKIGLFSLNKLNTLENGADLLTKHVPRAVLNKLAGMMGYTFPGEETTKFQAYTSANQNYWNQRVAAVEKLAVFDDGEIEELENDVRSLVDQTTHLTAAVLNRGVEMSMRGVEMSML